MARYPSGSALDFDFLRVFCCAEAYLVTLFR
jgi:hypothetical protein